MSQKLKRWESPRSQGRNIKGRGGSARARQLQKRQQVLKKKLKDNGLLNHDHYSSQGTNQIVPFFVGYLHLSQNSRGNS